MSPATSDAIARAVVAVSIGISNGTLRSRLCFDCGDVDGPAHSCEVMPIRENRIRAAGAGKNHSTVDALAGIGGVSVTRQIPSPSVKSIPDRPEAAHGYGCRAPLPEESARDYIARLRATKSRPRGEVGRS